MPVLIPVSNTSAFSVGSGDPKAYASVTTSRFLDTKFFWWRTQIPHSVQNVYATEGILDALRCGDFCILGNARYCYHRGSIQQDDESSG